MFQSYASRGFAIIVFALLVVNVLFFYGVTDLNNLVVEMGEDGLLENLQLVYLGLAALAFLIGGLRLQGAERMFAIGMCVLMLVFFFRELEVEPVGIIGSYIKSRAFRWHEAIVVLAIAGVYIAMRKHYVKPVLQFIFSRQAVLFYVAAAFIVFGEVFEKMDGFAYNEFFEEVLESLSYFLLLCLGVQSILSAQHEAQAKLAH